MRGVSRATFVVAAVFVLALAATPTISHARIGQALDTVAATNAAAVASQHKIDKLAARTLDMQQQYRAAIRQTQQLEVYNRQLAKIVHDLQQRKATLQQRIDKAGKLLGTIDALMKRMVDTLGRTVKTSPPFHRKQRLAEVAALRKTLANPDKSVTEKLHRVLAAYQSEARYGRTLGSYPGTLTLSGKPQPVTFLRVGRLMLFYLTTNNQAVGYYDTRAGRFKPLPGADGDTIRQAIDVIGGRASPQLIRVAVPAPVRRAKARNGQGGAGP